MHLTSFGQAVDLKVQAYKPLVVLFRNTFAHGLSQTSSAADSCRQPFAQKFVLLLLQNARGLLEEDKYGLSVRHLLRHLLGCSLAGKQLPTTTRAL